MADYTVLHVLAAGLLGFLIGHIQARLIRARQDRRGAKAALALRRRQAWTLLAKWAASAAFTVVVVVAVLNRG